MADTLPGSGGGSQAFSRDCGVALATGTAKETRADCLPVSDRPWANRNLDG